MARLRPVADLDYAFVADYVRVEGGKLTAVGASYTHLTVPALPAVHLLGVGGRVRSTEGADPVGLKLTVKPPGREYELAIGAELAPGEQVRPYGDGRIGLLFAFTMMIQLPSEGLYEVLCDLDDQQVRRLAFDVSRAPGK
jgi:hypothetical protein